MPTASSLNVAPLFDEIKAAGFPLVGAVDLALAQSEFKLHADRYSHWIAKGYHGEMGYLERGLERRRDPTLVFPGTKAVISCAIPYRKNPSTPTSSELPRYARYLEGPDYHHRLPELLEAALQRSGIKAKWKICVDTSAVLERSWAALAGLGWIGKNTLLIHPQHGSYLFLATILIDQETGIAPSLLPNYCGNCSACIEGCPTSAILSPGELDSQKCISYLTLEKRGEWAASDPFPKKQTGTWVAGCDICQEVCPYNRKPLKTPESWPSDLRDSALITDWNRLSAETAEEYHTRTEHSALSRVRYPDMVRNLENARNNIQLGGSGSPNSKP